MTYPRELLLAYGPIAYSAFYACWLGLGCGALAVLGVALLFAVPNRFLALSLPFLLYIGESVLASLLGQTPAAVMFAFFPFGLDQATLTSAVTGASMALTVVGVAALVVARARSLGNLQ